MTNESGRLMAALGFPLLLVLGTPAHAADETVPDVATIRENIRAAAGPVPAVF
jgi:hypothetical protein